MGMEWGLASPAPNDQSYLGPLQAMAAGRQAAFETRKLAARQAALGQAAHGDLEGAQRTALAGGDTETADYVRAAQARSAAGQVIGMYGTPSAQSPVQSLIAAGTPGSVAKPDPLAPLPDPLAPLPEQAPSSALVDHTHDTAVAIGHAAVSGQPVNQTQAWSHLYTLDPAMGDKMMAAVGQMDTLRKTRLAETTDALANAAQSLLSVPPEQRAAAAQQMLPMLSAHGVTADQLTAANLSDQGLKGIIGQSLGVKGMLEQANKETEFGFKDRETTVSERAQAATAANQAGTLAETARHNKAEEGKPISAGFGTALVKPDGTVVYDPNAPQSLSSKILSAEGTGSNPLSSAKGPGQFTNATFRRYIGGVSPEIAKEVAGMSDKALAAYRSANAATLAPLQIQMTNNLTNDNRAALGSGATDGAVYMAHVFGLGGAKAALAAGASAPAAAFLGGGKALTNNGLPATATVGQVQTWADRKMASSGPANPAVEAQAQAIASGKLPPLIGRAAVSGIGGQVMRRALEINPNLDGTTFATDKAGRVKFTSGKQGDTIRSLDVAVTHLDQLQTLADALHNKDVPLFNRIGQQLAQSTGSAVPTNFDSVKQFVTDEVTKAVIGSGGGVGDREKAAEILSRVQSPAQLAGAIYQIKGLMAGQLKGLGQQYKNATGRDDFSSLVSDHTAKVLRLHAPQEASGGTPSDIRAIMAKYGAR